jgi:hypothetical protein
MGVTNKNELETNKSLSKKGHLGNYLDKKGKVYIWNIKSDF